MITKSEMTSEILDSKLSKGLTWASISEAMGISEVFIASACLGNNSLSSEEAAKLGNVLDLSPDAVKCLTLYPNKGEGQVIPSDPLIYRFFEIAYVYGTSIKEVVHEKFGDGIMSAIDFTVDVDKEEHPKGDRVKIIMNGKFLPYKKW